MDMVHHNPGEAVTKSKFLGPSFLKADGYGAKVLKYDVVKKKVCRYIVC